MCLLMQGCHVIHFNLHVQRRISFSEDRMRPQVAYHCSSSKTGQCCNPCVFKTVHWFFQHANKLLFFTEMFCIRQSVKDRATRVWCNDTTELRWKKLTLATRPGTQHNFEDDVFCNEKLKAQWSCGVLSKLLADEINWIHLFGHP